MSYSVENYGRSIIIVPNKSLVVQTEADYINLGLDVGVYFGDRKEFGRTHTICTWQSLNNMMKKTKAGEAEVSITDFIKEAHDTHHPIAGSLYYEEQLPEAKRRAEKRHSGAFISHSQWGVRGVCSFAWRAATLRSGDSARR